MAKPEIVYEKTGQIESAGTWGIAGHGIEDALHNHRSGVSGGKIEAEYIGPDISRRISTLSVYPVSFLCCANATQSIKGGFYETAIMAMGKGATELVEELAESFSLEPHPDGAEGALMRIGFIGYHNNSVKILQKIENAEEGFDYALKRYMKHRYKLGTLQKRADRDRGEPI